MRGHDIERVRDFDSSESEEWEDPDENDGEWPFPTKHVRRLVNGPLAWAIRRRLGTGYYTAPVHVTEREISTGYSEYTQETDFEMTLECGDFTKEFSSAFQENNLVALLAWLDES